MNITDYWLMAREYSIWNATIASLQFWTADLDPVTLSRATEEVYSAYFYSTSTHTLCQQSDKILFGPFMIALNAAFDWQLLLADEGYESGSDTIFKRFLFTTQITTLLFFLLVRQHLANHRMLNGKVFILL